MHENLAPGNHGERVLVRGCVGFGFGSADRSERGTVLFLAPGVRLGRRSRLRSVQIEVLDRLEEVVVAPLEHQLQDRALLVGEQLGEHVDGRGTDHHLVLRFLVDALFFFFGFGGRHLHAEDAARGQVVVSGAVLRRGEMQSDGIFGGLLTFQGHLRIGMLIIDRRGL